MSAKRVPPRQGELTAEKAVFAPMLQQQKLDVTAHFTDDVLNALTNAFFEVVKTEHWGKRDLAKISGLNETGIGHILAGRRKNLTVETIALLARSMRKRPELILRDLRPKRNNTAAEMKACGYTQTNQSDAISAAAVSQQKQSYQVQSGASKRSLSGLLVEE
jgi:ribosomal protein S6